MRKICLRCGSKFGSRAEYCPHDGSVLVTDDDLPDPLIGTVLLEQFRIDQQIGTGGMGTVYRAHQTTVGRDVAIKVLRPELARDEQAVFRFEREARLAISLDHPNLVRVFISGRLADGRLYIVMELLEGRSLADELEEAGIPSIERSLIMIMKLCAGLGAVHAAGIVHRDIKPENVYLVRRGKDNDFVKLVDFGIARVLEAEGNGPMTTQSGRVFGTATYISPEAASGEDTDQRSDIYSLGVLTYQLLTGELPFDGSTAGAVLMQHVHREPPLLQTKGRGAEVPDDLARVVMRALSKDPDARQQSLAELLDALAEAATHAGLLKDARALLFGTVWGDELAAPGSFLSELLGSSAPPSSASPLADTEPVIVDRDPDDEALLSSAPRPFGTTSHDLAAVTPSKRQTRGWLWASLGVLALVFAGVLAGSWWRQRAPDAVAEETKPDPRVSVPVVQDEETYVADVGTDAQRAEPTPIESPPPAEEVELDAETPPEPERAQAVRKKRRAKKRSVSGAVAVSGAVSGAGAESESGAGAGAGAESGSGTVSGAGGVELEADDGIDWSVPDFPFDSSPALAPTGTPDAPPRNPIVIDEPPTQ